MESKRLAALVGPALLATVLSEMINFRIWAQNQATCIYLDGALLFIGGLSIVRVHNRWAYNWEVLLTVVGWSGIFIGLARMFAPRWQLEHSTNVEAFFPGMIVALAVGIYLTFKAYASRH